MKIAISIRHSKERLVRRENLIHPLRHSEERLVRRENLIL
jgi:ribosomal protein L36